MGVMFWLWSGLWILGWAVLIIIHFVDKARRNSGSNNK